MSEIVHIIVGFDQREAIAYHVFCQSVIQNTNLPVTFLPLAENGLKDVYTELHTDGSNRFTYTRFLTPYLMNFRGWAIFADGDMVCNEDVAKLWRLRDPSKAVQVVKHNYVSKAKRKYLGNKNENYPRKNWSSFMLWNRGHEANSCLEPSFVASKDGAFLHRFKWLDDNLIGELPFTWNWLATEYPKNIKPALVHYTLGTPCFKEYQDTDYAEDWRSYFNGALTGYES